MTVVLEWPKNPPRRGQRGPQGIISRTPEEKKRDGEFLLLQIDATVRETHNVQATATEHAVEDGAVISDHTILVADRITLEGVISNTPFRGFADGVLTATERSTTKNIRNVVSTPSGVLSIGQPFILATTFVGAEDRANRAYDTLRALRDAATRIRVITTLRDYVDMVIESLVVNRDRATLNSLAFSLSLKQIRVVDSLSVPPDRRRPVRELAPIPEEDRGELKKGGGTQTPDAAPASAETSDSSILYGAAQSIFGG